MRLAERYFAPHYAAPLMKRVKQAATLSADRAGAEAAGALRAGDGFEMLDCTSGIAWGIARPLGRVGYLPLAMLDDIA